MDTLTFKNISLGDFFNHLSDSQHPEDAPDTLRFLQKGAFDIFWKRHRADSNTTVMYRSIGHAASTIVPEETSLKTAVSRLIKKPITGLIRNPVSFHQDFRFVAFAKDHEVYMVLDNSALDANMKQVWRYDEQCEGFVASDKITLIEFLIGEEIRIPVKAKI